jgi:hypothetical protein
LRNAADEVEKMDAWKTRQEPPPGMDYAEWYTERRAQLAEDNRKVEKLRTAIFTV